MAKPKALSATVAFPTRESAYFIADTEAACRKSRFRKGWPGEIGTPPGQLCRENGGDTRDTPYVLRERWRVNTRQR